MHIYDLNPKFKKTKKEKQTSSILNNERCDLRLNISVYIYNLVRKSGTAGEIYLIKSSICFVYYCGETIFNTSQVHNSHFGTIQCTVEL